MKYRVVNSRAVAATGRLDADYWLKGEGMRRCSQCGAEQVLPPAFIDGEALLTDLKELRAAESSMYRGMGITQAIRLVESYIEVEHEVREEERIEEDPHVRYGFDYPHER